MFVTATRSRVPHSPHSGRVWDAASMKQTLHILKQRGRRLLVAAAGTAGEDSEVRFTSFFFDSAEEEEMSQT